MDPNASSHMCRGRSAFERLLTGSEGDIILVNSGDVCSEDNRELTRLELSKPEPGPHISAQTD